jgi:hypothetical protein
MRGPRNLWRWTCTRGGAGGGDAAGRPDRQLRFVIYSTALAPHFRGLGRGLRALLAYPLTDQTFGVTTLEYDRMDRAAREVVGRGERRPGSGERAAEGVVLRGHGGGDVAGVGGGVGRRGVCRGERSAGVGSGFRDAPDVHGAGGADDGAARGDAGRNRRRREQAGCCLRGCRWASG